jgi:hypothetical protein
MFPNFDLTFHVFELLTLAAVAWKVIKAVNRFTDVLKDFPPHRHDNGNVIYPKGFEPTAVQRLKL